MPGVRVADRGCRASTRRTCARSGGFQPLSVDRSVSPISEGSFAPRRLTQRRRWPPGDQKNGAKTETERGEWSSCDEQRQADGEAQIRWRGRPCSWIARAAPTEARPPRAVGVGPAARPPANWSSRASSSRSLFCSSGRRGNTALALSHARLSMAGEPETIAPGSTDEGMPGLRGGDRAVADGDVAGHARPGRRASPGCRCACCPRSPPGRRGRCPGR